MEKSINNTACFIGPKPKDLFGYNNRDRYKPVVHFLKNYIRDMHMQHGYNHFIFDGTQGIGQLAFWAGFSVKKEGRDISLSVYIPFKGQELSWTESGLFSQKEYRQMLDKADEVRVISDLDRNDASATKQELTQMAVKAIYARNHAMVDNSDMILAFYPDESWMEKGNNDLIPECMCYAMDTGKWMTQVVYDPKNIVKTMHILSEDDMFKEEEDE